MPALNYVDEQDEMDEISMRLHVICCVKTLVERLLMSKSAIGGLSEANSWLKYGAKHYGHIGRSIWMVNT